jgi:hypothetical protein
MQFKSFTLSYDAVMDIHHNVNNALTIISLKMEVLNEDATKDDILSAKRVVTNYCKRLGDYIKHLKHDVEIQPTEQI